MVTDGVIWLIVGVIEDVIVGVTLDDGVCVGVGVGEYGVGLNVDVWVTVGVTDAVFVVVTVGVGDGVAEDLGA